jgi:hypothetical protein
MPLVRAYITKKAAGENQRPSDIGGGTDETTNTDV